MATQMIPQRKKRTTGTAKSTASNMRVAIAAAALLGALSVVANTASSRPSVQMISEQSVKLIAGTITSVAKGSVTVKVADKGPGLTRGAGVHPMVIILGRSFICDTRHASYQDADSATSNRRPVVGDSVVAAVTLPRPLEAESNLVMSHARAIALTVMGHSQSDESPQKPGTASPG